MRQIFLKYNSPVLPGFESLTITSSYNSKKKERHRDLYNLRLLDGLKSANHYGMPQLNGYMPKVISKPIAFHEARALWKKGHSLRGYFIHFFIDDELFDCVRNKPEKYINMFKSADFIIAPDFSTYRNFPFPIVIGNTFDNLVLACFYEHNGVNVLANVFWSIPMFYEYTFSGQPVGRAICVSSNSLNKHDEEGVQLWLHGYKETICRLKPRIVIRVGKCVKGEENIFDNPIRINTDNPYVKFMRYGR